MKRMAATFVRLTIVSGDSQLDVSLPAQRPVAEYIDDVITLLGPRSVGTAKRLTLSSPSAGVLDLDDTLAEYDLRDGAVLHLTAPAEAAQSPFVDDVLTDMKRRVDHDYAPWSGTARSLWLTATTLALGVAAAAVAVRYGPRWPVVGGAVVLAVLILGAAAAARGRVHAHSAWAAVPLLAVAAFRATAEPHQAAGVAVVLAAAAATVALASAVTGVGLSAVIASGFTAVVSAIAAGVFALHGNATAISVWASIGVLVVLLYTPRMALTTSGLISLIRQTERAELAERRRVDRSLRRGRYIVDGLVWGVSVLTVAISAVVAVTGVWQQGVAMIALGVLVTLRSRLFSHARHAGALIAAGTASLVVSVLPIPAWLGWDQSAIAAYGVAVAIVAFVLLQAAQWITLPEVAAARAGRILNGLDMTLTIAYVPLVFFAQGVYQLFWP